MGTTILYPVASTGGAFDTVRPAQPAEPRFGGVIVGELGEQINQADACTVGFTGGFDPCFHIWKHSGGV